MSNCTYPYCLKSEGHIGNHTLDDSKCEECNGVGIFYFTGDNSINHAQPCGMCNKKSLEIVTRLNQENQKLKERLKEKEELLDWTINYGEYVIYGLRTEIEELKLRICDYCGDKFEVGDKLHNHLVTKHKDKILEESETASHYERKYKELIKNLEVRQPEREPAKKVNSGEEKPEFVISQLTKENEELKLKLDFGSGYITQLQQESKQAIEIVKRLEEEIELRNYVSSDCQMEIKDLLQSILKGDKN